MIERATDRPIIFSAPMVRALLAGRKTQTRRMLSIRGHRSFSEFGPSDTKGYDWHFRDAGRRWHDLRHTDLLSRLPFTVGDRLWVREAVAIHPGGRNLGEDDAIFYRATDPHEAGPWKPSIHMPRWASRLTLTVTDVRVQRLQDIHAADCDAEAFGGDFPHRVLPDLFPDADKAGELTLPQCFAVLWNSIHGPGAWDANPWVVALTFTVAKRNIDA